MAPSTCAGKYEKMQGMMDYFMCSMTLAWVEGLLDLEQPDLAGTPGVLIGLPLELTVESGSSWAAGVEWCLSMAEGRHLGTKR